MNPISLSDAQDTGKLLQTALESAFNEVLQSGDFINGAPVKTFAKALGNLVRVPEVITCGNGTDALQIALMALDLPPGSEVILPAFNYVSALEVVVLLGFVPVLADVLPDTFSLEPNSVKARFTAKTRAIIAVHLFGQCAGLGFLSEFCRQHQLYLIEDNAQSLGAQCLSSEGKSAYAGTVGHIGTTSFFPTKMLGALGDGGAIFTRDQKLATSMRQITRHGQSQKYTYARVGVNSRLDTLQAAFLLVKLNFLNFYISQRQAIAQQYDQLLQNNTFIQVPARSLESTHVFNQYVIQVPAGYRDSLRHYLHEQQIPTAVYYPSPLHTQPAYQHLGYQTGDFPVAEAICPKVIALPMHPALTLDQVQYITFHILKFFKNQTSFT
ncbi:DegT/DnrJ/EryC1/StrS family aminotransferase [Adhaeribacter swui]|uniref:DegT/DnrJ/EryC1/StrS family aminotransferase n=1 Tax=Adhaeribacter swui TaxID=2086471 RepID=A0A7G7GAK3_9BACT|nr:DegT/DnrJ/EryC1/StrS family aminotransferase [Adhaeribacter swui]QNF34187.1 DegT/DnrJ/EryC1/StrS family aminotransferase [Adhaeribacter swui]